VNDKEIEKNRYNNSAIGAFENNSILNIDELALPLRVPYIYYRKMIQEYVYESANVLEIGAGMGENTEFLLANINILILKYCQLFLKPLRQRHIIRIHHRNQLTITHLYTNILSSTNTNIFIYYRKMIQEYVYESANVLEIGAGMGENTEFLLATGAKVYATDISEHSLSEASPL
jgi:16S rRNA A1518/A1519 N6-dimethyltransferase RsmA/KsgA/DIM1 with predicted DNA glycosylase/AP lyase activity